MRQDCSVVSSLVVKEYSFKCVCVCVCVCVCMHTHIFIYIGKLDSNCGLKCARKNNFKISIVQTHRHIHRDITYNRMAEYDGNVY